MEKRIAFLTVVFMAVGACSSLALALPPMGPPRATLGRGQWAVDFEYAHQKMELDSFGKTRETQEKQGFEWSECYYTEYKIEDLKSDMFFGSLSYGICDNWDIFVRLGKADAKGEITETQECGRDGSEYSRFDTGRESVWGFGARVTFCGDENLTWGGLLQMTWAGSFESSVSLRNDPNFSGDAKLEFWEIQVAAGPSWQQDDFWIYGGPFLHFVKGDLDINGATIDPITTLDLLIKSSQDVREESQFGGYLGVQWDAFEDASFYAEYQFTGDAWGVGLGFVWRFE